MNIVQPEQVKINAFNKDNKQIGFVSYLWKYQGRPDVTVAYINMLLEFCRNKNEQIEKLKIGE